ncbi:MAG: very short patch repair endonuclease [Flavobacteriales bacterium]|nr:very short patch repair endonuclease [Flavobacteriales bacterium]
MPRRLPKPANAGERHHEPDQGQGHETGAAGARAFARSWLTGYRLHYAKVPGRPDIAFVNRKLAVFVHGCFWHGCPHCQPPKPKRNTWYWGPKLERNKERDSEKASALRKEGWRVVTLWECAIKRSAGKAGGPRAQGLDARKSARRKRFSKAQKN